MYKIFKIVLAVFFIFFSLNEIVFADELTFNDLIEKGKNFDKKNIIIKGEAIGDSMKRGSYTWINISDGTIPFGIWMKNEDAGKVKIFGDYHHRGDVVEVRGTFNRACSQHGGDMDIHADSITVVKKGKVIDHGLNYRRLNISMGITALTILLGALTYKKVKMT